MINHPSAGFARPPRRLSFGSVAEDYERYRLGYPDQVADTVFAYARRPVRTAVEIGAGTGKATRLFAGRGVAVTALEPDPDMLSVLQRTTAGLSVTSVRVEFEEFETDQRFDLVYAAAAWHWTDAETRWQRAVQLLARGGIVAAFGRPADIADPEPFAAVDEIERRLLSMEPSMNGGAVDQMAWPGTEMQAVEELTGVEQHNLPSELTVLADDYVARLATVSAYLMLTPAARADALRQVRTVLPNRIRLDTKVRVHLATKRG